MAGGRVRLTQLGNSKWGTGDIPNVAAQIYVCSPMIKKARQRSWLNIHTGTTGAGRNPSQKKDMICIYICIVVVFFYFYFLVLVLKRGDYLHIILTYLLAYLLVDTRQLGLTMYYSELSQVLAPTHLTGPPPPPQPSLIL